MTEPEGEENLNPCPKCGKSKWIKWADGQNYTCQQCGSFYLKKPIKVINKLEKLAEN
jgi:ribosomal protein L37AE/L43A